MVSSRKRGRQEMEAPEPLPEVPKEPRMLERIRNMWEFANLAQWIFIFGKAVKIDEDLDIEDLEMEFLKTRSTTLPELGLALLKFVSSHRGLTPDLFEEYTRRQYMAKAPERNPFGEEEEPRRFADFDVFTKIRVLQQLTQWTFGNPDRIRERMEEQKDSDQTYWRIEPFGWDAQDRTYIVLDDNRLYRQTEPPAPPPVRAAAPKKNSKKARAAVRASKRRKVSTPVESEDEVRKDSSVDNKSEIEEDNGLGGARWECLAISLAELNDFVTSIQKSRDGNERVLMQRIKDDLLPLLEKQEESRKRKQLQKERELLNLEKLASAKRSSRIAGRVEQQKQDEEAKDAERKRHSDMVMAKKEQERWMKLEKERESRMQTREQRVKEREARRILHEAELASLSEDSRKLETGEGRVSERHLKLEIERKKAALEELTEDEDWVFDCICGAYGQVDDGTHSIACEKCNVWQHTKCVGISEEEANKEDFQFVCKTCNRREKEAVEAQKRKLREAEEAQRRKAKEEEHRAREAEEARNRPPSSSGIKIKFSRPGSAASPTPTSPIHSRNVSSTAHHNSNGSPYPAQVSPPMGQQSPSKPAYSTPYTNGSYQARAPQWPLQTLSAQPGAQIQRAEPSELQQNAFAAPRPFSPTSLPPPSGAHPYASSAHIHTTSVSNGTPNVFPSPAAAYYLNHGPSATPTGRPTSQHNLPDERRSSLSFSSALDSAPVLKPSPSYQQSQFSGQNDAVPYVASRSSSSPMQVLSTPAQYSQSPRQVSDPGHHSALPPSSTGISPIKNSPPRLSNAKVATPHTLPPVAALSPSPQQQILTPPVKLATSFGMSSFPSVAASPSPAVAQSSTEPKMLPRMTSPTIPTKLPGTCSPVMPTKLSTALPPPAEPQAPSQSPSKAPVQPLVSDLSPQTQTEAASVISQPKEASKEDYSKKHSS